VTESIVETGSLLSRWRRGFRRVYWTPDWPGFAGPDWLARIMDVEINGVLFKKQGRTIGRLMLSAPDGRECVVYLKRHYVLPRRDGLLAVLFPGRARSPGLQEWEHLEWARAQGLPVPRAMAAGELVGPGGRLQSFLAVAELTGQLALHEAIPLAATRLDPATFRRWKRSLTDELVRLSLAFHGKHAFHKDWYLCHFYIDEADTRRVPDAWAGRVTVIDLHRLTLHRFTGLWRRVKDLAQLLYSADVAGLTDRDRLGFWSRYRKAIRFPGLIALFAKMKWRLYRRHNAPKG
jgi:heptose I phosphotransferase